MDLTAELARFDAPPELAQWVSDTLGKLAGENQRSLEVIRQRDLKIQALTLELSHLRRTRYGVRSEALAPEQRELFQETWNTDLAAVEAQAEQLATQGSAANAPTLGAKPCPITCRASNTATNPIRVLAGNAEAHW